MSREQEVREKEPGLLIVVTGPTHAGKDMVMGELLRRFPLMERVVTYTSRPRRPDEVEGVDYHFVTGTEFERMRQADKFLEWVPYGADFKGTTRGALEAVLAGQDVVWRIDMSRAAGVEELFRERFEVEAAEALLARTAVVAIVPDRVGTLKQRWLKKGRGDLREFYRRMRQDAKVWREKRGKFAHVVVNPNGVQEQTVERVMGIIEAKRLELRGLLLVDGDGVEGEGLKGF